jgi:hypothetical protein
MTPVCLNSDQSAVITVFGTPQNHPLPPGYALIDDADARILTFIQKIENPVPFSVSRFQAMAALSNSGLLQQAQSAATAAGGLTLLAWNNAEIFERSSPSIAALAAQLGLTSDQVDQLFITAAKISA